MNNVYESPLSSRYASKEMLYTFSSDMKFSTWRRLWLSLAKAERALGLPITQEQVDEMAAHLTDIDYDVAVSARRRYAMMLWRTFTSSARRLPRRPALSTSALPARMSATIPTSSRSARVCCWFAKSWRPYWTSWRSSRMRTSPSRPSASPTSSPHS